MTRIPLVPVHPSFLFIFQEEKIIAEIKKWNSKYCILISDSCFQCLYADRKFWSRRYLFPHLCIRISDSTGYPDREFFFLIQEERDSFKELIAKKDQLNRMQRSVAKTFQEVLELTGSLCFMFRSTPKNGSSTYVIFVSFGTPPHKESESAKFRDLYAKMALPWKKAHHRRFWWLWLMSTMPMPKRTSIICLWWLSGLYI